jgi:hypothetical protein
MPAKAKLQGFGGASAMYGCFYCVILGVLVFFHYYMTGKPAPPRDGRFLKEDLAANRFGMREMPAFSPISRFDLSFNSVTSACIDAMHNVCSLLSVVVVFLVYLAGFYGHSEKSEQVLVRFKFSL